MHRTRVVASIVAAAAFCSPILYVLLTAPAPDRAEVPMLYRNLLLSLERVSVPFTRIAQSGPDQRLHEMSISTPLPTDVVRHTAIGLTFSLSNRAVAHPSYGRLEFAGTDCVYETEPGAQVSDGHLTWFRRGRHCAPLTARPTGEITLRLRMAGPGDLGLWTAVLTPEVLTDPVVRANGLLYVAERDLVLPGPPAVMGSFIDEFGNRGMSRASLLAYMWTERQGVIPVLAVIAVSTLLFAAGVRFFPTRPVDRRARAAAQAGIAAGCGAAALAFAYAVIVPPLHAADETAFVRSYGELTNQPHLLPQFQQLARTNHFERIKGTQIERFRPRDIGAPLEYVHKFESLVMPTRSSTATRLWRFLAGLTRGADARQAFVLGRLAHALIFALTVGIATALLVGLTEAPYAQLLCFPFFLVPTLPFFGMQFSEAALLTSAAVLLAASIVIIALDGRRSCWAGFPFGLGAAALWLTTRSSLPMAAIVAAVAVARIMLARRTERPLISTMIFWGGVMVAALAFFSIATVDHLARIIDMAVSANARLADNGLRIPEWILFNPWIAVTATAIICAIGEFAFGRLRAGVEHVPSWLERASALLAYSIVTAIVASLLVSWWVNLPDVENIQSPIGPDTRTYTKQVLAGMLTMFRLRASSTFLSDSFWAGYGWLDTIPPDAYVAIPVTLTAVALSLLLLDIARSRNVRGAAWLVMLGGGALATLVAYVFAAQQVRTNIHGRFLLPWYMCVVSLAWLWPAIRETARTRFTLMLLIVIGLHAYALCYNLNRYF